MGSIKDTSLPALRWGIIGTGLISSWFVEDLLLDRPDARATHVIQAVGSSSCEKGEKFVAKYIHDGSPTVYGSYDQVYADSSVDIVYIGTPHAFHRANCLQAIAAGKHVLCEKAFTLNAMEAREVLNAAKEKGVFVMEAMWTRFTPLVSELRKLLFKDKVIGDVRRTFCDFGLSMDISSLSAESRLKNPDLGAGSLLDIGIYSLTWGLLTLEEPSGLQRVHAKKIAAAQTLSSGVDVATSIILHYPETGRQGILTSTTEHKSDPGFCRIEGTTGHILVTGSGASAPRSFTVYAKAASSAVGDVSSKSNVAASQPKTYSFDRVGRGFYWEADAVALDIAAGQTENAIMPHAETIRVMEMMDYVRSLGGAKFKQDDDARQRSVVNSSS